MKNKFFIMLIVLLLFVCSACNSQNKDTTEKKISAQALGNESKHIQKELEPNFNVDADVIVPANVSNINVLSVTPMTFDSEKGMAFRKKLIGDSKIIQNDDSAMFQKTSDGKEILFQENNIHFTTQKYQYIKQVFRFLPNDIDYNAEQYKQNTDLSFMPYKSAVNEVMKNLTLLGISTYDKVDIFALDYQTMKAQEKVMKDNGKLTDPRNGTIKLKDSWSSEDDCYFIILRSQIDNIPVYPYTHGYVENNTVIPSEYIYVCYSKSGIEYLSIMYPYERKSIDQQNVEIFSAETALKTVQKRYNNIILTDPTTITTIELYYVPTLINESRTVFSMIPAWNFIVKQQIKTGDGKKHMISNHVIINAITGEEIL